MKEKDKKICALIYCDPAKQDAVKEFVTGVNRGLPLYKRMVPESAHSRCPATPWENCCAEHRRKQNNA